MSGTKHNYTADNLAELNVLMLYDDSTSLEGIKIHKSADPSAITAANSLFEKGIITQADGGYLTSLGREVAEHTLALYTMLNAHSDQ